MINTLAVIFVLSVLTEAIMEYLGTQIPSTIKPYIAAAAAVAICLAYNADLPAALGLPSVQYVGPVVTGLVIGRGSNYLNDILKRIQTVPFPSQSVDSVPPPTSELRPPL